MIVALFRFDVNIVVKNFEVLTFLEQSVMILKVFEAFQEEKINEKFPGAGLHLDVALSWFGCIVSQRMRNC